MPNRKEGLAERQVIDRAIELYGRDDARLVFQVMLDTLVLANEAIEPLAPVSVIRLTFADIPARKKVYACLA